MNMLWLRVLEERQCISMQSLPHLNPTTLDSAIDKSIYGLEYSRHSVMNIIR